MNAVKWMTVVLLLTVLAGCSAPTPSQSPFVSQNPAMFPDVGLTPGPELLTDPKVKPDEDLQPKPELSADPAEKPSTDPMSGSELKPQDPLQLQGSGYVEQTPLVDRSEELRMEADILADNTATAVPIILETTAPGVLESRNERCVIDCSNTRDGYVMVNFTDSTANRLKARVIGPTTTYTYNIEPGQWTVFPLSDGNGTYKITLNENVVDNKYAVINTAVVNVELADALAPFLRPNQYVDYAESDLVLEEASRLTRGKTQPLEKVAIIYDFVVSTLCYDKEKAATVKSGYLPVLNDVLRQKKGICFDYAALMTGMLRSQNVPCRLVVGYAGKTYHAWIDVWSEQTGWVTGVVFFDGTTWHRMDPTFASSGNQSASIMEYIGNGSNYTAKYLY